MISEFDFFDQAEPQPATPALQTLPEASGEIDVDAITLVKPTLLDEHARALRSNVTRVVAHANQVPTEIEDQGEYETAIHAGRMLQAMAKEVAEFWKPIKQRIDQLKQPILDMERTDAVSLQTAKDRLGVAVHSYEEKQAEIQRQRLEEARRVAGPSSDGLPLPVIVASEVPAKTRGKVDRSRWTAEVVDIMKLVRAVAEEKVPVMALQPDQRWLDKRADADRQGMNIPGVVARRTDKTHFRA